MKKLLFVALMLAVYAPTLGQTVGQAVINTAGDTYTQTGITYEWSIGELALVETMDVSNAILTNGLLQPDMFITTANATFIKLAATNVLSPNGDGKNDYWTIKDIAIYPNNTVTIFDRAGRVVYTKHGYANDWGGMLGSSLLNEGTYYYVLDLGIGQPVLKGFVTIVRRK